MGTDETHSPASSANREIGDPAQLLRVVERLQAQLDDVRRGLNHANRLSTLGTISAIVAHEFNNILTPIISYGQMALAKPDDHAFMQKAVEKSLAGAERAAKISSAILGYAQDEPEAGRMPVTQIPQVIKDALDCLAREPKKNGIELILDLDALQQASENEHLTISHLGLQQVLVNLILNACRAMGQRGGRLTITAKRDLEHQRISMTVADTGPGVPPRVREQLFQPFVTERINDSADTLEAKGTGLGLSVCQNLIQQAGGDISLQEQGDESGAAFCFELPLAA